MNQFEPEDDLGNPWLAILIGCACFVFAWYLYAKLGGNPHLIGKAAIANSGFGRKLLIGMSTLVGAYFFLRGVAKIRSGD